MTIRKTTASLTAVLLVGSVALGGCSAIRDTLGANKYPPDEFAVVAKTPLIIPPEYNLQPPGIGNPNPREVDTSTLAMRALFPEGEEAQKRSEAEQLLLQSANADQRDAEARSNLAPGDDVVGKGSFTEGILYEDAIEGRGNSIEQRDSIPPNPND